MHTGTNKTWSISRIVRCVRRFAQDRRGVAAVEFAFIAPLMLAMYFVTMELAQGIETNKKVSRVGSMVADLVTQQPATSKSEVEAIMKIAESILQPYTRSKPTIRVTAINITANPGSKVEVAWSRQLADGAYSRPFVPGVATTVPAALNIPGSFLVRVESELGYKPMITWTLTQKQVLGLASAFDNIAMTEGYYLRPRVSSAIPCLDC